jgi:hypothetical protein
MEYRDSADERHTLFSIGSIERGPDGKPSGVTDMTPDALQSRQVLFEDLLPPGRPTALQRELARALLKRLGFGQVSLNEIN